MKKFSKSAKIGFSTLIVVAVALVSLGVAMAILPSFSELPDRSYSEIVAIILENDSQISVDADFKEVYVTIKYADGSAKLVELSELQVAGLDVSKVGLQSQVELIYGGFKQYVEFDVIPTQIRIRYVAPGGGGRIEGKQEQFINAGYDASKVRAIPDEGYEFIRWSDGNPKAERQEKKVAKSEDFIATFAKKEFIVAFQYPDGTLTREEVVQYNDSPNYVPNAEVENQMKLYGYKFNGWSQDFSHVTEDMIIIATYIKHAVDFHLDITKDNIGRQPLARVEHPEDFGIDGTPFFQKEISATINLKIALGRVFEKWQVMDYEGGWHDLIPGGLPLKNLQVAEGVYMDFGTAYLGTSTDEVQLTFIPPLGVNSVYVKAHVIHEEAVLTFNSFNERILKENGEQLVVRLNNKKAATGGTFERETLADKFNFYDYILSAKGHEFVGWQYIFLDKTYTIDSSNYQKTYFDQSADLHAVWKVGTYEVLIRADDNEDESFVDPAKGYNPLKGGRVLNVKFNNAISSGEGAEIPGPAYKENHDFIGWYAEIQGQERAISFSDKLTEEGLIIYPKFKVKEANVAFNVQGSGAVYLQKQDESGLWYDDSENLQYDTQKFEVLGNYQFSVKANPNYYISSITVNNVPAEIVGTFVREYVLFLDIPNDLILDFDISIIFTVINVKVSVENGDVNAIGEIEFLNDVTDDNWAYSIGEHLSLNNLELEIPFQVNSTKALTIIAPENFVIYMIIVNGIELTNLTAGTRRYVLEVQVENTEKLVKIVYERMQKNISVETPVSEILNGEIVIRDGLLERGLFGRFDLGYEYVSVYAKAYEGFYIKSLSFNGLNINPYQATEESEENYIANNVEVKHEAADLSSFDPRITSIVYRIRKVTEDVSIEIEFAPIFYYVEVEQRGIGEVSRLQTGSYNSKMYVSANTSNSNYISSYTVNGETIIPSADKSSINYIIELLQKDYFIVFEFSPRTYAVSFSPDEHLSIYYQQETYPLVYGKTFDAIDQGSNLVFVIRANNNYNINSIKYKQSSSENWVNILDLYNVNSYEIKIDGLSSSYQYEIKSEAISSRYSVKILGLDGTKWPTVYVGSEDPVDFDDGDNDTYISNVNYGNKINVELAIPGEGYKNIQIEDLTIAPSFIQVKNASGTDFTYEYLAPGSTPINGGYFTFEWTDEYFTGYIVEVFNVGSDVDIVLSFIKNISQANLYEVEFIYDTNLGNVYATHNGTDIGSGDTVTLDENDQAQIVYTITAVSNYYVKMVSVNGEIVAFYDIGEGELNYPREIVYTSTARGQILEVSFVKQKNKLTLDNSDPSKGLIFSQTVYFENYQTINVKVLPATGYLINTIRVIKEGSDSYEISRQEVEQNQNYLQYGIYETNIRSDFLDGNLYVEVIYNPKSYNLEIIEGGGGVGAITLFEGTEKKELPHNDVLYGQEYQLNLVAATDNHIKRLYINGIEFDVQKLENIAYSPNFVERVLKGDYFFKISANLTIEIEFEYEEYSLRLIDSRNGEVSAKADIEGQNTAYVSFDKLKLRANDMISIYMVSNYGYNIRQLLINDVVVWENTDSLLNITSQQCFGIAKVSDYNYLGGIINVEVIFAVNLYSIQLRAVNGSPNFKYVDTAPEDFGTITISGQQQTLDGFYANFIHGSNVRVNLMPKIAKGYYISSLIIKYSDANLGSQDLTSYIANIEGDSYLIRRLSSSVEEIVVEYRKHLYSVTYEMTLDPPPGYAKFEFKGDTDMPEAYNPNDRNQEVFLVNGQYEYGLGFKVKLNPGEGYERTLLEVNGVDRQNLVRGNEFNSIVNGTIFVQSKFEIKKYRIDINYAYNSGGNIIVTDSNDSVIWSEFYMLDPAQIEVGTGTVWRDYDTGPYLMVTHKTILKYKVIPHYDTAGYRISQILRGNTPINVVNNGEEEIAFTNDVVNSYILYASFVMSTYDIAYRVSDFDAGVHSLEISKSEVNWGEDITLSLIVKKGYYLSELSYAKSKDPNINVVIHRSFYSQKAIETIQGSYDVYGLDVEGKQIVNFTISEVNTDITFVIKLQRCQYDITFEGDYDKEFAVSGGASFKAHVNIGTDRYNPEISKFGTALAGTIRKEGNIGRAVAFGATGYSDYIGLSYNDYMGIKITAPEGYDINQIEIKITTLLGTTVLINNVRSPLLSRVDLYNYRVIIDPIEGDINIKLTYKIRGYKFEFAKALNGSYLNDTANFIVNHHEQFEVALLADYGYYLHAFTINNYNLINSLGISKVTDSGQNNYAYTTTVGDAIRMANRFTSKDAVLNAQGYYIVNVASQFDTLKFDVSIFARENEETAYQSISNSTTLSVSVSNNKIVYDEEFRGFVFVHNLAIGHKIQSIYFYNNHEILAYSLVIGMGSQEESIEDFISTNPDSDTLSPIATAVFRNLDYYNPQSNKVIIRYTVAVEIVLIQNSIYYVRSQSSGGAEDVVGGEVSTLSNASFSVTSSSGQRDEEYNYGTIIEYVVSITAANESAIEFAGFQEYVKDSSNESWSWVYLPENSPLVQGTGNNKTLTIEAKTSAQYRSVFFELNSITVSIMPAFSASSSPSKTNLSWVNLNLKAYTRYNKNGAIYDKINVLPKIFNVSREGTIDGIGYIEEEIATVSIGNHKVAYQYLVRSGAHLRFTTSEVSQVSYYVTYYTNNGTVYAEDKEDSFKPDSYGAFIQRPLTLNAYYGINSYTFITFETIGGDTPTEGGSVRYKIDDGKFNNLSGQISVPNNTQLTIEIEVNLNYRYEMLGNEVSTGQASTEGKLLFGQKQQVLTGDDDKKTTISYYNASDSLIPTPTSIINKRNVKKIQVVTTNVAFHRSYHITFVKQIRVFKHVQLLNYNHTDGAEINAMYSDYHLAIGVIDSGTGNILSGPESTGQAAFFDFGVENEYTLNEPWNSVVADVYKRPYQFVGFMVNGKMMNRNLANGYPDPVRDSTFKIELNGDASTPNGASFVYEQNKYSGVNKEFVVHVVVQFMPLLNVLVENSYYFKENEETAGVYVNTGQIAVSTVEYFSSGITAFESSYVINAQMDDTNYTNLLMKVPEKIQKSDNNYSSDYDKWAENQILLNWLSEKDDRSISFVQWEFYGYSETFTGAEKFQWIPITYESLINGKSNSSKETVYRFPLSALLPQVEYEGHWYQPYYYYQTVDGFLYGENGEVGSPIAHIADSFKRDNIIFGEPSSKYPVLRIRPRFERKVLVDILPYLSTVEYDTYEIMTAEDMLTETVNPSVGASGLSSQAFLMNDAIILEHNNIDSMYDFDGWYYRPTTNAPNSALIKLNNQVSEVEYKGAMRDITYYFLETEDDRDEAIAAGLLNIAYRDVQFSNLKNRLVLKLDWSDGDYLIAAKYTKLYDINVNIINESGSDSPVLNDSRPVIVYYGTAPKDDPDNWTGAPISSGLYSLNVKVRAGYLVLFQLDTLFVDGVTNALADNVFNPNYDRISSITVHRNRDNSINAWEVGVNNDKQNSINPITINTEEAKNPDKIEETQYGILADANKQMTIGMKSTGTLTIHNVYEGSEIKLPDKLAIILGLQNTSLIKDNVDPNNTGLIDKDPAAGVIKIENIPIEEGLDLKGKSNKDFGMKISEHLSGQKVLANDYFNYDITFDGADINLRKEQHVVIFKTANVGIYNIELEYVENLTLGENIEKPFAGGDGSYDNPFIIETVYQLKQIDALYRGNDRTLHYGAGNTFAFKLGENIDLSDLSSPLQSPLCSSGTLGFNGVLDGNGKSLYNLNITSNSGVGLFKLISDRAHIKNLNIGASEVISALGDVGFLAPLAKADKETITIEDIGTVNENVLPNTQLGSYVGVAAGALLGKAETDQSASAKIIIRNITLKFNASNVTSIYDLSELESLGLYTGTAIKRLDSTKIMGAAGGAVGIVRGRVEVNNVTVEDPQVSTSGANGRFAGGAIGVLDSEFDIDTKASNITVRNPEVLVEVNHAGGVVGVVGDWGCIDTFSVNLQSSSSVVQGAYLINFEGVNEDMIKVAGIGGAVGINYGKVYRFQYQGTGKYQLLGGIVGGVIGINNGTFDNSPDAEDPDLDDNWNADASSEYTNERNILVGTARPKLQSMLGDFSSSEGGGIYGGVVGWNRSNSYVTDVTVRASYSGYATPFAENSAYFEVAANGDFTSNTAKYTINKDREFSNKITDLAPLYVGGIIGYNSASSSYVTRIAMGVKISVYREHWALVLPLTYVNSIVGNGSRYNLVKLTGRIEVMKTSFSDEENEEVTWDARSNIIDYIGYHDPAGGAIYVRYLSTGEKFKEGKKEWFGSEPSGEYRYTRFRLYTKSAATLDIAISVTIAPDSSNYSISYGGSNILAGYIHDAGGTGFGSAYNYTGNIRQTIVSRTNG